MYFYFPDLSEYSTRLLSFSLHYIETAIFSLCRGGGNMEDKKVWMSQLSFHSHTTRSHIHTYSARVGYHKIHTKKLFPCFFHFSEQNSLPRKHYQCLQVITAHAGIIQTVKNPKSHSPSFRTDKKMLIGGGRRSVVFASFQFTPK